MDQDNLSEIISVVKYLLERTARLIVIMPSYDQPIGEYKLTKSTNFFFQYLKKTLESSQIFFENSCIIDNFEEKMETEAYPDNSIVVLENCYF